MITTASDYATIRYQAGIERTAALRQLVDAARHYLTRRFATHSGITSNSSQRLKAA